MKQIRKRNKRKTIQKSRRRVRRSIIRKKKYSRSKKNKKSKNIRRISRKKMIGGASQPEGLASYNPEDLRTLPPSHPAGELVFQAKEGLQHVRTGKEEKVLQKWLTKLKTVTTFVHRKSMAEMMKEALNVSSEACDQNILLTWSEVLGDRQAKAIYKSLWTYIIDKIKVEYEKVNGSGSWSRPPPWCVCRRGPQPHGARGATAPPPCASRAGARDSQKVGDEVCAKMAAEDGICPEVEGCVVAEVGQTPRPE